MEKLTIVKIGGNSIDDAAALDQFLAGFGSLPGKKILVHGGGKIATALSEKLGIETLMLEGRRVTDQETLRVVTMVYAGWINKTITAKLQALSCPAIGLSGADGNLVKTVKRTGTATDYGFAGDCHADSVSQTAFADLLEKQYVPVISPITHDGKGQLLNTNADTIAATIAVALSGRYETRLFYCFEKNGVLRDALDDASVIPGLHRDEFISMKQNGQVSKGMIPKLENAFFAKSHRVQEVVITHAKNIGQSGMHLQTEILV